MWLFLLQDIYFLKMEIFVVDLGELPQNQTFRNYMVNSSMRKCITSYELNRNTVND